MESPRYSGLLGYLKSMPERLTIEEQLERKEKELEDLRGALDQSSIVAFTDSAGVITYVNDKFCEISKYSREELIGQNHRIINSDHHPKEFFMELWKTISSGKVWKGEIRNRAKDGSHYWVLTTITPFLTPKGRPFKYVAIRTDITEQKHVQHEAEQQRSALLYAEKMASVGELAAGIGHELGNPLAALRGRVELLESMVQSGKAGLPEVLKTTETLKVLADRMASIIRGMKSLSRDGSNDPVQKVSLGQLLRDVLGFTYDSFQKHGIQVRTRELDDRVQVRCQETQISQVFVNLINNAKDAAIESEDRWIQVEVLDRGEDIEVAVSDSGKGIPPEIREKIMMPFFTTKPVGKGTGLGLSISTAIVESHGGKLTLDADFPHTRFIVRLPKNRA